MKRHLWIPAALLSIAMPVEGAELRIRESLLIQQRDLATITVTAVVTHIGHSVDAGRDVRHPSEEARSLWKRGY